jgi:D-glycero-alpha-D-manno-heptose-7-phosphate kinase
MRYKARAPLRIDFGGGWTDVPIYAEREGGAVLSAAITRYARGFIARPEAHGVIRALRGDRSYVSYTLDVPPGSGLGGSAAQTVLWVTLVKTTIANVSDRREIAEIACRVESLLGILGGKQDEYASAFGGINFFTFGKDVEAERLDLSPSLLNDLRSRLVLVYSGESRISGSIHERVWGRFLDGEPAALDALHALRRLASELKEALVSGDLDSFGELLTENWRRQKQLDASVTDRTVNDVFDFALANGAMGGKACGAGGGGCLVFLSRAGRHEELREAMSRRGLKTIEFDFDTYGVHLTKG